MFQKRYNPMAVAEGSIRKISRSFLATIDINVIILIFNGEAIAFASKCHLAHLSSRAIPPLRKSEAISYVPAP
jgi:hypothetical protein